MQFAVPAPGAFKLPPLDGAPAGVQFADAAVFPWVQSEAFELPGMLKPLP